MEDDINSIFHNTRKRNDALLSVYQPAHRGSANRARIVPTSSCFFGALPQQQGRNRESTIERIEQERGLARLPHILTLKFRYHDPAGAIVVNQLGYLDRLWLQHCIDHSGLQMNWTILVQTQQ